MMTLVARWFAQTSASQDYERSDYIALWLVLMVGALVRFWGLGNVGLHGDEETMAMPAMAILETGQPVLPSGMYYARALLNIYMMSGSAWLFGESEWAFRLPSAIVGSLTGLAAFFMGRRFLAPQINLAFVATITLLPSMIVVSQTARMYVFFVTCIIWFGACLFRWERDQRIGSLLLALIVWLLALHFQRLAIFAAPLFLFPGLVQQSWKQLMYGAGALGAGLLIFDAYGSWIGAMYPAGSDRPAPLPALEELSTTTSFQVLIADNEWLVIASIVLIAILAFVLMRRFVRLSDWTRGVPIALVCSGLLAFSVLNYHAGGILLILGSIFWLRAPSLPRLPLVLAILLSAIITVIHLGLLYETGLYPGRKLIGALVGVPSVWPTLRFLVFSPVAGVMYGIVLLFILARFTKGRAMPVHVLFFAISVWAPLLTIGYFNSYIPLRYALAQVPFFLMCTFAGVAFLAREKQWVSDETRLPRRMLPVLVIISAVLINPYVLARTVNPGYELYPDHKGAAEFIQGLDLNPDTILIAEDVLQQTYYLGRVDYWLCEIDNAISFSIVRDGRVIDQYTGTPVIGTGDDLVTVLNNAHQHDVYVLGNGENFFGDTWFFRGRGISEVLESQRLKVVYSGRDGRTKVWKLQK